MRVGPFKDYYRILQVEPTAGPRTIRAAYRRLSKIYHPDAASDLRSTRKMQDINVAYEVLSSLVRRLRYDYARFSAASQATAQAPPAARHAPPPVHPDSPLARNFRAAIRLVSFVFREISSSAAAPDKRVPYFFMFLWSLLLVVGLPLLAIYLVAQGLHTGQLEPLLFGAIILGDIAGLAYVIRRRSRS